MWYILNMNKDVIYIEPEDDITDIITKIEKSKEKIVALVPPKKAGVFRSVVNIKLIAKVGTTSEKTIVLVTTDPSIIKLAAATKIPVTKDLQTPPAIPSADIELDDTTEEELVDESAEEEKTEDENNAEDEKESNEKEKEGEEEKEEKKSKAEKKPKKAKDSTSKNAFINWIKTHKKLSIFGGIAGLVLIIFLIWAFAIAPAATVTVGIQTESKNFAENVTFVTDEKDENAKEGKFYLQEKKVESTQEVQFDATGQKNKGEKAKGELNISVIFASSGAIPINAGTKFTINGLTFLADEYTSLTWNGDEDDCNNEKRIIEGRIRCEISGVVSVTAAEAGTKYNIAPSSTGWSTVSGVDVNSTKAMAGGTDDIVTVVEQIDIEKAKDQLKSSKEEDDKKKLYENIDDNMMVIDSSFEQETPVVEATPAAGEEVKEGQKPVLKVTAVAKVYMIDKSKVEEFVKEKAKLGDDQKIYEFKDPYIENFVKGDSGYAGRLKTTYAVGPKITDNDILDMIKGKGVGDAQHELKNIDGIVSVSIDTSYPWVGTIPGDTNKITVNIEIKDTEKSKEKDTDKEKE